MRLFTATLATETNTFSPLPTSLENYKESVFFRPGEHPTDAPRMCTAPLMVGRARAKAEGFELIEGSCFAASPAGTTNRADYEFMRDEILGQLKAALPVDGLLLGLHGAMVAHGYDDVEGDIIERCREIVGTKCVIGVELDPHCHLTMKRLSKSDIIVLYKEFPHTDVVDRAEDVLDLVLATLRGKIKPVMSVYDCRQIQSYPTTLQPMRSLVDRLMAMEGKDGILSVSIAHCFPYGDVAEIGTRVLVITDGDKKKADALATSLGEELVSLRGKTTPTYLGVQAGVGEGVAFNDLPVVIADPADNAGGGAPSDNTAILHRLVARGVTGVATGCYWDPIAVQFCIEAGVGATFDLRIGGKCGTASGEPVDLKVTVRAVANEHSQGGLSGGRAQLGASAWVSAGGIDIILNSTRSQVFQPDAFTGLGLTLADKRIVVVKSTQHFHAGFAPIAAEIRYVAAPGAIGPDFANIPFTRRTTPYWPRVVDPWATNA
jgi:microcystin degradation protein MlrC